ncbi:MAG: hypothetical protein WC178_01770 [Candidatus Paceibacterota bacterium]
MTIKEKGTHAYLGFSLICGGIEFLGACLDKYSWEKKGLSEKRFRLAINQLFPEKYKDYNTRGNEYDIYSNVRCSLVHSLRPGNKIGLSERYHEGNQKWHLKISNGNLIIIYEDLLDDFIAACKKVQRKIEVHEIKSEKVYGHVISTPQDYE